MRNQDEMHGASLTIYGLGEGEVPYMQLCVPLCANRDGLADRIIGAVYGNEEDMQAAIERFRKLNEAIK